MSINRRDYLKQTVATGTLATIVTGCSNPSAPTDSVAPQKPSSKTAEASNSRSDYGWNDAVAIRAAIKNQEITALQAIEAAIERAQTVNPQINAIVTETFSQAREQAQNASQALEGKGAFSGVPTFIKDLFHVKGIPTEFGSRAYRGVKAKVQFPFIDDFQAGGLISLGKTSTPEFGLTATTEPMSSGPTRNPWNTDHSCGGSSGGAAALVAAGVVPMAHATDGGGSIRIPASCCGLVGLKPSRDRFRPARDESHTPVRISAHGVVSRTMRDTAAFLAAMEIPSGEGPLASVGLVSAANQKRLTIGVINTTTLGTPLHQDVANGLEETAQLCQALGHKIIETENKITQNFGDQFLLYWAAAANFYVSRWEDEAGQKAGDQEFEPFTLGLRQHFLANQEKLQSTVLALIQFSSLWKQMFEGVDVILSPVLTSPPVKIGYLGPDIPYEVALQRLTEYAQYTAPANVAGTPSLSLPLAMSSHSLPIGMLFNARSGQERVLLELGYELETAMPWASKIPPVFAA